MKILFTGGGTGGHVNPALAIAETVKKHDPKCEIAFVGTPNGIENKLVPKAGYKLHHINIQGLKRKLTLQNIKTLYLTVTSVSKAKKLLKAEKPDAVVGTGGYVCYPLVKAAAKLKIPTAVHESNAIPGVAIKMLAPYVDVIFTDFEKTREYINEEHRHKIMHVGNPYFENGEKYDYENARRELAIGGSFKYSLLVYGGSLGAANINANVTKWAQKYLKTHNDIKLTHATGTAGYEDTKKAYISNGFENDTAVEVLEYIYDMPRRMAAADVIVCRAGAMTLSELAMTGKPAVLVPYPYAAENHQYKNAKVLADGGAAILIEDSELTEDKIESAITKILYEKDTARKMADNIRKFSMPEANEQIYKKLMEIIKNRV